jgi:hypothetical protein
MNLTVDVLEADIAKKLAQGARMRARREACLTAAIVVLSVAALVAVEFLDFGSPVVGRNLLWVVVLQLAGPWIGFFVARRRKRSGKSSFSWSDRYVYWILLTVFLSPATGSWFAYVKHLNPAPLWAAAALLSTVLCFVAIRQQSGLKVKGRVVGLVVGWCAGVFYLYGAGFQLNCVLDSSPATLHKTVVVRQPFHAHGNWGPAVIQTAPWDGQQNQRTAPVPESLSATLNTGSAVCAVERQGLLGVAWYTLQACSAGSNQARVLHQ